MATGDLHKQFCEDRSSSSRDMLADRQTQTDRQVNHYTPHPLPGQSKSGILATDCQTKPTNLSHGTVYGLLSSPPHQHVLLSLKADTQFTVPQRVEGVLLLDRCSLL